MSNFKDGKKPLSQKPTGTDTGFEFGNKLFIEPELKAKAATEGKELRFISAKKLYENAGYHENGWTPYIVEKGSFGTLSGFKFGNDPDGVLRRGDAILACRSVELSEKHRTHLKNKASKYSQNAHKKDAENLDHAMRKAGLGKAIIGEDNE